jgi:hypothetical protein
MAKVFPWRNSLTIVEGGTFSRQFMHNAGAPYKFIVKTSTQPLEEAAAVITEALELLRSRVNLMISAVFNEVLSVTYMEGQRMEVKALESFLTSSTTTMAKRVSMMSWPASVWEARLVSPCDF